MCPFTGLDPAEDEASLEDIYDEIYDYFIEEVDASDYGFPTRYCGTTWACFCLALFFEHMYNYAQSCTYDQDWYIVYHTHTGCVCGSAFAGVRFAWAGNGMVETYIIINLLLMLYHVTRITRSTTNIVQRVSRLNPEWNAPANKTADVSKQVA